jgi:superfamily I DNA and/or RNA helicase
MMGTISYHLKWGALGEDDIEAYIEKQMQQTFEPFKNFHARMQQHNGTHFLPEQRRMFRSLSDMISTIFYDTTFDWKKESEVADKALPQIIQKNNRLMFINTPHSSRYKEWKESANQQHSRQNKLEAEAVVSLLHHFENKEQVVILAPYKGQVELIRSLLPENKQHIQVHTTDGFQGKEADFVILSLVRNNILSGRRRWGFVTDPHRLNVALSRAKEGLLIVSSMQQINESEMEQGQDHLQQVLRHIEKHGSVLQIDDIGGAKSG